MPTPLKTLLFCPATEPDKIAKIAATGADAAVIDLEDSVSDALKTSARADAFTSIASDAFADYPVFVRVNSVSTGRTAEDVAAIMHPHLNGIVLPKTDDADSVRIVESYLAEAERRAGVSEGRTRIIPLIETAAGVYNAVEILRASARIETAIFGFVDYMLDVGIHCIDHTPDAEELLFARSSLVLACRVAGVSPPLDGPFLEIRDPDALLAQCRQARSIGLAGKMLIHPSQVPIAHEGFAPSREEVEQAMNIIKAFTAAEKNGVAAVVVDGRLVDYPVVHRARKIIASAPTLEAAL